MSMYDVLFCSGTVVTSERLFSADIAVVDGRIVAIKSKLERSAAEIVDASGLHLFPTDDEPGRIDLIPEKAKFHRIWRLEFQELMTHAGVKAHAPDDFLWFQAL